jgi:hypothetical protein
MNSCVRAGDKSQKRNYTSYEHERGTANPLEISMNDMNQKIPLDIPSGIEQFSTKFSEDVSIYSTNLRNLGHAGFAPYVGCAWNEFAGAGHWLYEATGESP